MTPRWPLLSHVMIARLARALLPHVDKKIVPAQDRTDYYFAGSPLSP